MPMRVEPIQALYAPSSGRVPPGEPVARPGPSAVAKSSADSMAGAAAAPRLGGSSARRKANCGPVLVALSGAQMPVGAGWPLPQGAVSTCCLGEPLPPTVACQLAAQARQPSGGSEAAPRPLPCWLATSVPFAARRVTVHAALSAAPARLNRTWSGACGATITAPGPDCTPVYIVQLSPGAGAGAVALAPIRPASRSGAALGAMAPRKTAVWRPRQRARAAG